VRHTFTHFHLRLDVRIATVAHDAIPDRGAFIDSSDFRPADLPTLMRKVFDLARSEFL
jgi:A/G-specific adenine glycosylase